jgi:hypothetical protein
MNRKLAALCVTLLSGCLLSLQAQAQTSCSNASLSGTYFYLVNGPASITASGSSPYVELGEFVADGNGGIASGQSVSSLNGTITPWTFSGNYVAKADCSGTLTLSFSSTPSAQTFPFQIVEGGQSMVMVFSTPNEAISGRIYRAANRGVSQCGLTSLSGNYGYLLSGVASLQGNPYWYSNAGQLVSTGSGNISTNGVANIGTNAGGNQPITGTGTYSIASDCSGTAQLTNAFGTTNYRVAVVEGGTVLFIDVDPGYTVAGSVQPQLIQSVLPQLAFGGGWYSALYFTNTTNAAVSFSVSFTKDDGTPLTVPAVGGASTQVNVPAGGTAIVEAPNTGPLSQGYATFTLPPGVSGYGVFRQSVPGQSDQEAVVPFVPANATSSTLVWDDTSYITGVAIVNPGPVAATISITVSDNNGNAVGTYSLSLPPYQKTENALRSYSGLAGVAGLRGRAQFAATSGNVAVLGLRFNGYAFTSIPTTQP